jgi:polysaccharide pyruvyl transferase WcaK-like protein
LRSLFANATIVETPTHRRATLSEMMAARRADLSIVGGTNILKSHMLVRGNWRITPLDFLVWRNVVLLGVGWQQYGRPADAATRLFFRSVLSKTLLHSVRDMHTYEQLRPHVRSLAYTGCPTMWMLDGAHCSRVPVRKARDAIFAVTYYRPAPAQDLAVFELLRQRYETVYFWPQQASDVRYLREIGVTDVTRIPPDVAAYDSLLAEKDVDFVGARLHGGIRALQHGRRALVIPVDNRAIEIGKMTSLPVVSRNDSSAIARWIDDPAPTRIVMPWDAIAQWREQFVAPERQPALMAAL